MATKKAIKVELALDDINELVTKYFQITDTAQSKAKGVLNSLREVLSVYENTIKQQSQLLQKAITLLG